MQAIKAPQCISDSGKHNIKDAEFPYYGECEYCFERFILVSESVAYKAGIKFVTGRKVE